MIDSVRFDDAGLVPGIVQDSFTGRVLMLGYLNRESLARTMETGEVHFWSRSRATLWKKGETSGNTLTVRSIAVDCDGDALLIQAEPAGPTCHTGAPTCFDDAAAGAAAGAAADAGQGFASLERLWNVVAERAAERPSGSYTTTLLDGGVDVAGRKVTEEATEVLMAAKDLAAGTGSADRLAEESADLLYHLLVLFAERNLEPRAALEVLAERGRR